MKDLKSTRTEYLEQCRKIKDLEEKKRLLKEYAKLHLKIKYYTDEENVYDKLQKNKDHLEGFKRIEYYLKKRNDYSREYYLKHYKHSIPQMAINITNIQYHKWQ